VNYKQRDRQKGGNRQTHMRERQTAKGTESESGGNKQTKTERQKDK
jgi:hypothetical protein